MALMFLIFLMIPLSSALTASIDKPKMVLYEELVIGETIEFENSVIVNNHNDYTVDISVSPSGYWRDKAIITESEFSLNPAETKEVFYTVTMDETGNHGGEIIVNFKDKNTKESVSLAQRLVVDVTEVEGKNSNITGGVIMENRNFIIIGSVSIIIFTVLLIILTKFIGNKKWKK